MKYHFVSAILAGPQGPAFVNYAVKSPTGSFNPADFISAMDVQTGGLPMSITGVSPITAKAYREWSEYQKMRRLREAQVKARPAEDTPVGDEGTPNTSGLVAPADGEAKE